MCGEPYFCLVWFCFIVATRIENPKARWPFKAVAPRHTRVHPSVYHFTSMACGSVAVGPGTGHLRGYPKGARPRRGAPRKAPFLLQSELKFYPRPYVAACGVASRARWCHCQSKHQLPWAVAHFTTGNVFTVFWADSWGSCVMGSVQ